MAVADDPRAILLVEDDPGDAVLVEDILLSEWPQLRIAHVASLADAQTRLDPSPDCVLLDLGLPDAHGIEALAQLRAAVPDTAVVVLTGDIDSNRAMQALGVGAQDYLVKGELQGPSLARSIAYAIERKESERVARELAVLRVQNAENQRVARGLVPEPLLLSDRVKVRSVLTPGNRRQVLGGDFLDVVQTEPGRVHAVLGDVCGHGPDEAALGVQLRIAWRVLTLARADTPTILGALDQLLVGERHARHVFVTLATLTIDLESRTVSGVIAGHPPPVVAHGGHAEFLVEHPGSLPLGLDPYQSREPFSTTIDPGSTVLMFSDGIFEGRTPPGDRLGLDSFVALLAQREVRQPVWDAVPDGLVADMETLNGGPLDDDVALLAMTFDDLSR